MKIAIGASEFPLGSELVKLCIQLYGRVSERVSLANIDWSCTVLMPIV